jgi:photosystem II stability/assembly factor-like uncharacterized protein
MKKRKLFIGASIAVAIGFAALTGLGSSETPVYKERQEGEKEKAQSIQRAALHYQMLKFGDRTPDNELVLQVREELQYQPTTRNSASNIVFEHIGPDNVGGRIRALIYDNSNSDVIYAAGVSGGLFKSTNGGLTWNMTPGQPDNKIVTSIVQDDNGDIYLGTGELDFLLIPNSFTGEGSSGFLGDGIWKSTDGGDSFTQVLSITSENATSAFYGIYRLAFDGGVVYAATDNGMIYSQDGGQNWNPCQRADGQIMPPSVSKDVKAQDGVVFANVGGTIYRTTSGPENFERLDQNFSGPRTEIAIAPSDNNIVYTATVDNQQRLRFVLRSTDQGDTWTQIGSAVPGTFGPLSNSLQGQGNFNCALAVFPNNPDRIILGGVQLWDWSVTGGWTRIGSETFSPFNPFYVHADKHAFAFHPDYGNGTNRTFLIGSDGGVGRSMDGGNTFDVINRGFNVTQYYAIDYSSEFEGGFIGGTQDNGSNIISRQGPQPARGERVLGGDGFASAWSKFNPNIVFATIYDGLTYRSEDKGNSFAGPANIFSPRMLDENDQPLSNEFNTVIKLWEKVSNGGTQLDNSLFVVALDNELWGSRHMIEDNSQNNFDWFKLADVSGNIQRVEFSIDGDVLYIGTETGNLYMLDNVLAANDSVTGDVASSQNNIVTTNLGLAGTDAVTGIGIDPEDKYRILVTRGGYAGPNDPNNVALCPNTNASNPVFQNKKGNLPGMPIYDGIFEMGDNNRVIIGTEYGVWYTDNINDNGPNLTWVQCLDGIENIPVFQILQKRQNINGTPSGLIYAASHGRGVFRSSSFVGVEESESVLTESFNVYPNPATDYTTVSFEMVESSDVVVELVDLQGRVVETQAFSNVPSGQFEERLELTNTSTGNYIVRVRSGNGTTARQIMVNK